MQHMCVYFYVNYFFFSYWLPLVSGQHSLLVELNINKLYHKERYLLYFIYFFESDLQSIQFKQKTLAKKIHTKDNFLQ